MMLATITILSIKLNWVKSRVFDHAVSVTGFLAFVKNKIKISLLLPVGTKRFKAGN